MGLDFQTGKFGSLAFSLTLFVLFLPLLSCKGERTSGLPTVAPTAELISHSKLQILPKDTRPPIPATYTPQVVPSKLAGWNMTMVPAASVQPTTTVLPKPTPMDWANIERLSVNIMYVDRPPEVTDCETEGTIIRSLFPSKVDGPMRPYHAYLPPCYGQDGRVYPVLYLLHGSIQNDSHWLDLGLAGYIDAGIADNRFPPFIVIMPDNGDIGNYTSGGPKSVEGIIIDNLLPFVEQNYCTWPSAEGRSIGGISRGGYWALEIAFTRPNLFGSVSGHSSHLRLETDPVKYNPLSTYESSDLTDLQIWLDRGETDFLWQGQEHLHTLLSAAGVAHQYQVFPGGHSDSYWANHLPQYIDWHAGFWPTERKLYPKCQ